MTDVVASDLDRTLIWSARAGGDIGHAVCVETYDGQPLSYVDATVMDALRDLVAGGLLVPVTTRTEAQYRRIELPGTPARFAICLNGGRVLADDCEDRDFRAVVQDRLAGCAPARKIAEVLFRWAASAESTLGPCRVRDAEGLFHYAVFDRTVVPSPETEELAAVSNAHDWQLSLQGRKVYLVPRVLTKEDALGYLEEAHGLRVLGTAGDSLLDRGMLERFGHAWVPRDSELHRAGGCPAGSVLTAESGLPAGVEIVGGLARLLG